MLIFLKLYLAHLIADFLLQTDWVARNKTKPRPLLKHSGVHLITAVAVVNVDLTTNIGLAIVGLAVAHAACDYLKARYTNDDWLAFAADQFAHFLMIAAAAALLTSAGLKGTGQIIRSVLSSEKLFLFLCAYIMVIFGGGYFVQKVTQYFMNQIDPDVKPAKPGLPKAGKYIGWLERALVLTFVVTGYPEGIGLLLAGKALVRYPEIKEDSKGHFAEYFLIGTLTSVSLALLAGLALAGLKARLGNSK